MKNALVLRWAVVLVALVVLTFIVSCASPAPVPTVGSTTAPKGPETVATKGGPPTAPVAATTGPTVTPAPAPTQAPITCRALEGALNCDVRSAKCQVNGITGTCIQFVSREKPTLLFLLVIPTQKKNQPLSVESVKFANSYPTPVASRLGRLLANFKVYGGDKNLVSEFEPPLVVVAEYDEDKAPKLLMYDTRWTVLPTRPCEGAICPKSSLTAQIATYDANDPCVAFGE